VIADIQAIMIQTRIGVFHQVTIEYNLWHIADIIEIKTTDRFAKRYIKIVQRVKLPVQSEKIHPQPIL